MQHYIKINFYKNSESIFDYFGFGLARHRKSINYALFYIEGDEDSLKHLKLY